MPSRKAEVQEIVNALLRWGGKVSPAADELGIRRKNLYERIERLGINLEAFRHPGGQAVAFDKVTRATRPARDTEGVPSNVTRPGHGVLQDDGAPFTSRSRAANLLPMQAAEKDEEAASPVRTVAPRQKIIRLRPAFQEQLRDARYDLMIRFRLETDENLILEQFFEECFGPWLVAKLQPTAQPKRERKPKETER